MIHARALTRTFRTRAGHGRGSSGAGGQPRTTPLVEAVRGVDLDVGGGEIVGFLGPNGAGKTTTLRILTTLLAPTSGEATVAGRDLRRDPVGVRRRIGYVAQTGSTLPEARAGDELVDQARLFGLPVATARQRGATLFDRLDLGGLWDRPCRSLSGGQRRRLDIALGLVHDPRLVFLDEPTTGLDPQSRANLWQHVRRLRAEQGTTVFLTTHYLDEADALCDRVLVIDHGRIVATGTPDELKRRVAGDAIHLTLRDPAAGARGLDVVSRLAGAADPVADGRDLRVRVPDGAAALPALMRDLEAHGVALDAAEVRRPTLDDVFLTVTGRSLRDVAPDTPQDVRAGVPAA